LSNQRFTASGITSRPGTKLITVQDTCTTARSVKCRPVKCHQTCPTYLSAMHAALGCFSSLCTVVYSFFDEQVTDWSL